MKPVDNRPSRRQLALILAVPVIAATVMTLFAAPSARLEPRALPIAVAGTGRAADAMTKTLETGGAFDVHRFATARAARAGIEDREVYAAFVLAKKPKLLLASAASPVVAEFLSERARRTTPNLVVEDVVPAPRASAAIGSSVLPLVLTGVLTALLSGLLAGGRFTARAAVLVAGATLGGAAAAAVFQPWLGATHGSYWALTGGFALTVMAVAAFVAGLDAMIGHAGIAVGALTMILVGNPFSGVTSAPELLPKPLGSLGQLMPPGAGSNLVRSVGLFDGADARAHAIVLAAWALGGFVLLACAAMRPRPVQLVAKHATT